MASIFAQTKPEVVAKPNQAKKVETKLAVKASTPLKKDCIPDLKLTSQRWAEEKR